MIALIVTTHDKKKKKKDQQMNKNSDYGFIISPPGKCIQVYEPLISSVHSDQGTLYDLAQKDTQMIYT